MKRITVEDTTALRDWVTIKDSFLTRPLDRITIENMIKNGDSLGVIVSKTYDLWLSGLERGQATFRNFLRILRLNRLEKLAGKSYL